MKPKKTARELYREAWRVVRLGDRGVFVRPYCMPLWWKAEQSLMARSFQHFDGWSNHWACIMWQSGITQKYPHLINDIPF